MKVSYKAVLKCWNEEKNVSAVERRTGYTRNTIRKIVSDAKSQELLEKQETWEAMSDEAIRKMLRKQTTPKQEYLEVPCETVHEELKNPHVTVNLLHEEYVQEAKDKHLKVYSRTQFYDAYKTWAKKERYSAHIKRKPGNSLELDFPQLPAFLTLNSEK